MTRIAPCAHGTAWPRCLQCHALGVRLPDLRQMEPELLEDEIENALYDSLDQDWTVGEGARAVMRLMFRLAIATEARRAETENTGSVHEGTPND